MSAKIHVYNKKYSSPVKGELKIILFQEHFEIRNMLQLKLICNMSV